MIRFASYTESHARNGEHRIERGDVRRAHTWNVFLCWRHVATFFKRSDARVFIREAKRVPRYTIRFG